MFDWIRGLFKNEPIKECDNDYTMTFIRNAGNDVLARLVFLSEQIGNKGPVHHKDCNVDEFEDCKILNYVIDKNFCSRFSCTGLIDSVSVYVNAVNERKNEEFGSRKIYNMAYEYREFIKANFTLRQIKDECESIRDFIRTRGANDN